MKALLSRLCAWAKKYRWGLSFIIFVIGVAPTWVSSWSTWRNAEVNATREKRESELPKLVLSATLGNHDGVIISNPEEIGFIADQVVGKLKEYITLSAIRGEFGDRLVDAKVTTPERLSAARKDAATTLSLLGATSVLLPLSMTVSNNSASPTTIIGMHVEFDSLKGGRYTYRFRGDGPIIEVPGRTVKRLEREDLRYFQLTLLGVSRSLMVDVISMFGEDDEHAREISDRVVVEQSGDYFIDFSKPVEFVAVDQLGTECRTSIPGKEVETLVKAAFRPKELEPVAKAADKMKGGEKEKGRETP